MSGDNGTSEIDPVTAVMAVSRFPFAVPESHFGDEGQMACVVAGFTDLLLPVTSLSILEARSHLCKSQDCSGADGVKAPWLFRNRSHDSLLRQPLWVDQSRVDPRHFGCRSKHRLRTITSLGHATRKS